MVELRQCTLMHTDVKRVHIDNYRFRNADGEGKCESQLVIELATGHMEQREQIRIMLTHDQQKRMYKSLKKALGK